MADFDDKFYDNISKALDKMMKECYNKGVLAREDIQEERTDKSMTPREEMQKAYEKFNKSVPTISKYSRCLNLLYLKGQLDPCYHRDSLLVSMQKILLRKNKANVLLTGAAGCGKTAIAEGLAGIITERRVAYQEEWNKLHKEYVKAHKAWERKCAKIDKDTENVADYPAEPQWIDPPKPHLASCVIYDLSLNALVGGTKYRG